MLFVKLLEMLESIDFDGVRAGDSVFLWFSTSRRYRLSSNSVWGNPFQTQKWKSLLGGFRGVECGVKLGVRVAKGDLAGVRGVLLLPTRLLPGVADFFAWLRCQWRDWHQGFTDRKQSVNTYKIDYWKTHYFGVWWVLWYSLWVARMALAPTDNVHIVQSELYVFSVLSSLSFGMPWQ